VLLPIARHGQRLLVSLSLRRKQGQPATCSGLPGVDLQRPKERPCGLCLILRGQQGLGQLNLQPRVVGLEAYGLEIAGTRPIALE
jgi:hypothetical protein